MTSAVRMDPADGIRPEKPRVPLLALVDLENQSGGGEHVRGQVVGVRR